MSAPQSSLASECPAREPFSANVSLLTSRRPLFQRVCGLVSSNKAVFLVQMIDILLGLWYIVESLLLLSMLWLVPAHHHELVFSLTNNSISICVGFVAIVGLCGSLRKQKVLFSFYYRVKLLELLFSFLFCPMTSHVYCPPKDLPCQTLTLVIVCISKVGVNGLAAYILHIAFNRWPKVQAIPAPFTGIQLQEIFPISSSP